MANHPMDYIEAIAAAFPERLALVFRSEHKPNLRLTFGELDARINRAASVLVGLGIGRGDHVGCHMYDSPAHVELMFAAWKLGAVPINVNFRYMGEELAKAGAK